MTKLFAIIFLARFFKIYYGLRWFCRGRKYKYFGTYYLHAMSYLGISLSLSILITILFLVNKWYKRLWWVGMYLSGPTVEMLLLHAHKEHLENLRNEQNSVLRDRQIL